MNWILSFTKLFLLAVAGYAMYIGSSAWAFANMSGMQVKLSMPVQVILGALQIIGLLVVLAAPLLILLKLFALLDRKSW